ncbi:hypothetical protein [Gordonia metallireducens]|uniref:hypothetical protein n=1 Tax=Gordonia metallireducens TaxID=2897779 RepID=UPI001E33EA6E|nr:hypothetical protein [Gordonia metallireducens]
MRRKLDEWPRTVILVPFGVFFILFGLYGLLSSDVTCGDEPMSADDRCVQHADDDGESLLTPEQLAALPTAPRGVELSPQFTEMYADIASLPEWAGRSRDEQRARDAQNNRVIVVLGLIATGVGFGSIYIKRWWLRRRA